MDCVPHMSHDLITYANLFEATKYYFDLTNYYLEIKKYYLKGKK